MKVYIIYSDHRMQNSCAEGYNAHEQRQVQVRPCECPPYALLRWSSGNKIEINPPISKGNYNTKECKKKQLTITNGTS